MVVVTPASDRWPVTSDDGATTSGTALASAADPIAWFRCTGDLDAACRFSGAAVRLLRPADQPHPSARGYLVQVHEADRPRAQRALLRAARDRLRSVFEHRWHARPGTALLWCGPAGPDGDARVPAALAVLLDVTGAAHHHHAAEADSVPALVAELAQLTSAVASRDVIGQAKGVLMERHALDADQAFRMLRGLSHRTNVPISELARRLVERSDLPLNARHWSSHNGPPTPPGHKSTL